MNEKLYSSLVASAGFDGDFSLEPFEGAGSDRLFFRINSKEKTAVLISGQGHGADLERWVDLQKRLRSVNVGVPELFAFDNTIPAIVVEDLGGMPAPSNEEYPFVIEQLVKIQSSTSSEVTNWPEVLSAPFDFDEFRHESRYFTEEYLVGFKGKNISEALCDDFDEIANSLSNLPKGFCHRDFQSSNITIQNSRLRVIDFQSAKFGPFEYDLVSLLWDSRVELDHSNREKHLKFYYDLARSADLNLDLEHYYDNIYLTALSRTMQSLGAYCFLSQKRGKTQFARLIAPAEKHLIELIEQTSRLKALLPILKK